VVQVCLIKRDFAPNAVPTNDFTKKVCIRHDAIFGDSKMMKRLYASAGSAAKWTQHENPAPAGRAISFFLMTNVKGQSDGQHLWAPMFQ
jgi:hypothetical protein